MGMMYQFILPICNFVLQSYPRLINKYFGVDVWTRLLEIEHIRNNNHNIPNQKLSGQFLVPGYFDYPPLFPFIFSFISKENLLKIQGFVAPFFDSLQVILVYYVAYYITGDMWLSLLAQLFYTLTPMVAIENSYFTPRSLGYLLFSTSVMSLLLYFYSGESLWFLSGLFSVSILFLTHRFALQSFVFITLFFSVYLKTYIFLLALISGFVLAVVFTKGYYLRVLKGHLYNIYFWVKNLDYRFAHQVRGLPSKDAKPDFVGKIYVILSAFSPIVIFGLNSWAISGFLLIGLSYVGLISTTPLLTTMAAWIIFFYLFGVIVLKIKYLMPIGEGQRYMEMATVPASVLSAYIFFGLLDSPWRTLSIIAVILLIVVNLGLILFIQIKGVIQDRNRSVTTDLFDIFSFMNSMKKTPRVLCIPHQNTTMTIYHTKANVFVNADNPGLMKVTDVFPVLKEPVRKIAEKYDLTHLVLKESFATLSELKLQKKDIVHRAGDIILVRLK